MSVFGEKEEKAKRIISLKNLDRNQQ